MTTGNQLLANALKSGKFLAVGPGESLARFDDAIGWAHTDTYHGRKNGKLLRRDYGVLEATFGNPSDWVCRWVKIEIHRFATSSDLIEMLREDPGVEFSPYVSWEGVRRELERISPVTRVDCVGVQGEYEEYYVSDSNVTVQVIGEAGHQRGTFPGTGDIWSIELSSFRRHRS